MRKNHGMTMYAVKNEPTSMGERGGVSSKFTGPRRHDRPTPRVGEEDLVVGEENLRFQAEVSKDKSERRQKGEQARTMRTSMMAPNHEAHGCSGAR